MAMNFSCLHCSLPATIVSTDNKLFCSPTCLQAKQDLSYNGSSTKKLKKKGLLQVKGRGEVKVKPDMVRIKLKIEKNATTAPVVNEMLIADASKLIALLTKEQTSGRIQKIETGNLQITPAHAIETDTDSDEERRRKYAVVIGYDGVFPINFESAVAEAGPLIDLVLKQDNRTTSVEGLEYFVSESISLPASKEALRLATIDARTQAEIVLLTLGKVIIDVVSIAINSSGGKNSNSSSESYSNYSNKSKMHKRAPQMSTQLFAPESEVIASVSLEITY